MKRIIFSKKWFDLYEIFDKKSNSNFYGVKPPDYVTAVAFDRNGGVFLVIQERPVIEKTKSLETPGGQVDKGETPIKSIKRELVEELGLSFEKVNRVAILEPDVGRLMNKLHVFKAENPIFIRDPEVGIKVLTINPEDLIKYIYNGKLSNAYSIAAISIVLNLFKNEKNK